MVWSIGTGDRIHFPKDIHYYDIVEIKNINYHEDYNTWVKLEDCLNHTFREVRLSTIKEEAKIIRRTD